MLDLLMGWCIHALLVISSPAVLLVSEQPLFSSFTSYYFFFLIEERIGKENSKYKNIVS